MNAPAGRAETKVSPVAMVRAPQPVASQPAPVAVPADAAAITPDVLKPWAGVRPDAPRAVMAFRAWAQSYLAATPEQRPAMEAEGLQLAAGQRQAIKTLIPQNPRLAIENAVPMVVRQDLPEAIVAKLEQRVNDVGRLSVMGALPATNGVEMPKAAISRMFTPKGKPVTESLQAFTFGSRLNERTLKETRVNGVAVDGVVAISDQRVRRLEPGERIDLTKEIVEVCPVSGITTPLAVNSGATPKVATANVVAAQDNKRVRIFCSGGHISSYNTQLANEEASDPANQERKVAAEGGAGGGQTPFNVPPGWTTGTSTILYIPVAFPDIMQSPRSEAESYDTVKQVTDYYLESSFGRFYLVPTVAPLAVVPYPESWYVNTADSTGQLNGEFYLFDHALDAARKAGFDANAYDLVVIDYKGGPGNFGGLGYVGGPGVWLKDQDNNGAVGVLAHELGHNLGLLHSNYWQTTTQPPTSIGPGHNVEYGNKFDVMGGSAYQRPLGHYVANHKYAINWLTDNMVHNVQANGSYRIYQMDQGRADADKRYALHVSKDSERDYWVEFRQGYPTYPNLASGVMLTWSPWGNGIQQNAPNGSDGGAQLIDTTPGSFPLFNLGTGTTADTRDDAGLVVGRTFADPDGDVYITPIAKGTTTPPYMDVVVNHGPFPTNQPPTLTLTASALVNLSSLTPFTFTATATDPDGDALAYAWDFGDSTVSLDNQPTQVHKFPGFGRYYVTCTASDMKGKRTTRALLVQSGGADSGNVTISGTVHDAANNPLEGVMVTNRQLPTGTSAATNATTFRYAFTDSDGKYTLTQIPVGSPITVTASQYPLVLSSAAGATTNIFNPINNDQTGVDFVSSAPPNVITLTVTRATMTEGGATAEIVLTRPATSSGNLDVQFMDNSSGTAILGTDYTITAAPTPSADVTEVQFAGSDTGTSRVRFAGLNPPTVPVQIDSITLTITATNDFVSEGVEYAVLEFPDTAPYPIIGPRTVVIPITDAQTAQSVVKIVAEDPGATEAGHPATMRLERNGSTASSLAVNLSYSGVAGFGTDYSAPTTVTIPAGSASTTFTVTPLQDVFSEGTETGSIDVQPSGSYQLDTFQTTADFIIVDDDQPVVTIAATVASTTEGSTTPGKFTISRISPTADISLPLTIEFSLGGSALPGQDYRRIEGTAVIPAYETSVDILIEPVNDTVDEADQTVVCRLSNNDAYAIGAASSATVTIIDNDTPEISIQSLGDVNGRVQEPSATTGASQLDLFAITRPTAGAALTVNYRVKATSTATVSQDYYPLSGKITFNGTGTRAMLSVTVLADTNLEDAESLTIELLPGTGYRLGLDTEATIWIIDQAGRPSVDVSLDEQSFFKKGNRTVLTNFTNGTMDEPDGVVFFTVESGGSGYTSAPTVVLTGGGFASTATATASVTGGAVTRVTVNASGTGYTSAPTVTFTGGGGGSGALASAYIGRPVRFMFTRTNSTNASPALQVAYSLGGTATGSPATNATTPNMPSTPGVDYLIVNPSPLTIPAGAQSAFLTLFVLADADNVVESTESITVNVVPGSGYAAGRGSATGYIHDFETYSGPQAPTLSFVTGNTSIPESSNGLPTGLDIPVSLVGTPPAHPVTVNYYISGGDATGRGIDYTLNSGTLSFGPGESVKNIHLDTVVDNIPEGDETVSIQLENPVNADLGAITSHDVTITDDAVPETFTDPVIGLPSVTAELAGHVHPNTTGVVNRIVITNGGTGYTTAPVVTISGGGGFGAIATATVSSGVVTGISVTGGTGYTSTPTVSFSGGGGTGAAAVAVVAPLRPLDGVGDITVITGGAGYLSGPVVTFTGGGGSGAAGLAVVSGGAVTGVTITRPGSGYTSPPTIGFSGGGGTGASFTAVVTAGAVTSATPNAGGTGYNTPPAVTITGGGGSNATALATVVGGAVTAVTVIEPGSGYTSNPTVTISGGGGTGATAESSRSASLVRFEWGTTPSLSNPPTAERNAGYGSGEIPFSSVVASLPTLLSYPQTYYYRAVARNGSGTTKGIVRTLHTVNVPTATTNAAASHTSSSITLQGTCNTSGLNATAWFEWGSTTAYGSATTPQVLTASTSPQTITALIGSLPEGTLLHYRVVVQTPIGLVNGLDQTAVALQQQIAGDLLVNLNALQGTAGTATWSNQNGTLGGNFLASGTPSLVASPLNTGIPGVAFNGVTDNYLGPNANADILGNDNRSIEVWVLNPGLGTKDDIVSLGRDNSLAGVTLAYNNSTTQGAMRHGGGTSDAGFTALPALGQWHHLVYTYNGNKVAKVYVDGALAVTKSTSAVLNTIMDTVAIGTTRDSSGVVSGGTFSGFLNSLRIHGGELTQAQVTANYNLGPAVPAAAAPIAVTKGASLITPSSATLNGAVVPRGLATTAWIEWGVTTAYDNASVPQSVGSGWTPGAVTLPITALADGIEYHFRVVAQNASGTTNGADAVFTTSSLANAGILWVDLRATDASAGSATWHNRGGLGNFAKVGTVSSTFVTDAGSSGIPAVQFNGTNDAYESFAPADADISFNSDRTIETWVFNPTVTTTDEASVSLGRNLGRRQELLPMAGNISAWKDGTTTVAWPSAPLVGAWHHVVLVHSGTNSAPTVQTFVDGVLVNTTTVADGSDTQSDSVVLAAGRDSSGALTWGDVPFSGFINSVRIHGGALTAAQVAANFTFGPYFSGSLGVLPGATTVAPETLVTASSATLHGLVVPGAIAAKGWIEWDSVDGTVGNTFANKTPIVNLSNTFSSYALSEAIGGLTAPTYFYRAVAQNTNGTVYGTTVSFNPSGPVGTSATTNPATAVLNKSATLNGVATTGGVAVNSWFEYGVDGLPGLSTTPKVAIPATLATKPMTAPLSALKPHTTYWFRLAVDNGTNKFVGAVRTFTTGNAVPVATNGTISIKEDTVTTLAVKGTDGDGETLSLVVVTPPSHGGLSGSTLAPVYTPAANYVGPDSFTFKVSDGGPTPSNTATFNITITALNDVPVANNGVASGNEDAVGINGSVTATDVDGTHPVTSYAITRQPFNGVVDITNAATGAYTYVPNPDFFGTDTFTFVALNTIGISAPATITITVTGSQDAPIATNSGASTPVSTAVSGQAQASDPDGDSLTYSLVADGSIGHATVNGSGAWTYTPTGVLTGNDSFTFKAFDGTAYSNVATISIIVGGPTANAANFAGVVGDLITGTLTGSDPGLATLTFSLVEDALNGPVTINPATGAFRYNPEGNPSGQDFFTFKVNNGTLDSQPATVTLVLAPRPPNWTWVGGANTVKKPGTYGTLGVAASANLFGARSGFATIRDGANNTILFGGSGIGSAATAGLLNDVWKQDGTGDWAWVKGSSTINAQGKYGAQGLVSATNTPGARSDFASWRGSDGRLWIFGGTGRDSSATGSGLLNDLWVYDSSTNNWTWIKGSTFINANGTYGTKGVGGSTRTPGARSGATAWTAIDGTLWLFGGNGRGATGTTVGNLNDLWKYDPASNVWTWVGGPSTLDNNGTYDTRLVANSRSLPGGRSFATAWVDVDGLFYLFGGTGKGATLATKGNLNDLWSYDPLSNTWTWLTGSNAVGGAAVYGSLGIANAANTPGARSGAVAVADGTSNTLLFGGQETSGLKNDVWRYDAALHTWTWIKGPTTTNGAAVYGVNGTPEPGNTPGARRGGTVIADGSSNTLFIGGANGANTNNDIWSLEGKALPVIDALAAGSITDTTATLSASVNPNGTDCSVVFSWWPLASPASVASSSAIAAGAGVVSVPVSTPITGLTAATAYGLKVIATNAAGSTSTALGSFTTTGVAGIVSAQFVSTASTVGEADGLANLSIILTAPAPVDFNIPITYNVSSTASTADYTQVSMIFISKGQTGAVLSLPVINDTLDEGDETIMVDLGTPSGVVTIVGNAAHTVTITDDEVAPSVTTDPASVFAATGVSTTFTVVAVGSNITYQWKKDGTKITGATSASYTIAGVKTTDVGNYTCDVSNALGLATSGAAGLFVVDATGSSKIQAAGTVAAFTVNAYAPAGSAITYQWKKGGVDMTDLAPHIAGSPTKTLTLTTLVTGDSATYTCAVSKSGAPAINNLSGNFVLAVPNAVPAITSPVALTSGVVNVPYSYQVMVDTDPLKTPTSFAASGLPAGLTINATTGLISGTVKAAVLNKPVVITASNGVGTSAALNATLSILALPVELTGASVALADRAAPNGNFGARVDVTVNANSTYTAKLAYQGLTLSSATTPLAATVNLAGTAVDSVSGTAVFARAGKPSITMPFTIVAATNVFSGTITDPLIPGAVNFTGWHNKWGTTPAAAYAGYYTMALDIPVASVGVRSIPQGTSYASFTVINAGTLSFVGKTADGQGFTVASITGPSGQLPFFAAFTTSPGSLIGELAINSVTHDVSNTLTWIKGTAPATSKDMAYRAGFGPLTLTANGGLLPVIPAAASLPSITGVFANLSDNDNNAEIDFLEGGLDLGDYDPVVFSIRDVNATNNAQKVTVPTNSAKVTFTLATSPVGGFSGTFTVPNTVAALARKVTYQAILVHDSINGYRGAGYFLLPQLPQPGQTLTTSEVLSGFVDFHPN